MASRVVPGIIVLALILVVAGIGGDLFKAPRAALVAGGHPGLLPPTASPGLHETRSVKKPLCGSNNVPVFLVFLLFLKLERISPKHVISTRFSRPVKFSPIGTHKSRKTGKPGSYCCGSGTSHQPDCFCNRETRKVAPFQSGLPSCTSYCCVAAITAARCTSSPCFFQQ